MNPEALKKLLSDFKDGNIDEDTALNELKALPFKNLDYAKIDTHRALRVGAPEVIYCEGKNDEQLRGIIKAMIDQGANILGTRASLKQFNSVKDLHPELTYHRDAKIISLTKTPLETSDSYIAIVSAGTSDIPVAEEAALTASFYGNSVKRVYDVGVAGIHRLFSQLETLQGAKVIIVVAGMEGALASVVGGLVNAPIIAVPTSVGYGANLGGISALLTMLNSCASGISVVNIDNGFGAGYQANMINHL